MNDKPNDKQPGDTPKHKNLLGEDVLQTAEFAKTSQDEVPSDQVLGLEDQLREQAGLPPFDAEAAINVDELHEVEREWAAQHQTDAVQQPAPLVDDTPKHSKTAQTGKP